MSQPSSLPVLMYHRIAPVNARSTVKGHYVHPRLFEKQMAALKRLGYQSIRLDEVDEPRVEKPIVITFDDGYVNFLTDALPSLKRHGFTATVFLVADLLGKTNEWDSRNGDVEEPLMSIEQIEQARSEGTDFGSHTLSHADLAAVDEAEAWRQIADSKSVLEKALGNPISTFCYPYGRKTPKVQEMVREAGYRLACSTEKGMNTRDTDRFALRRINVRSDTHMPVFLYKLMRGARDAR